MYSIGYAEKCEVTLWQCLAEKSKGYETTSRGREENGTQGHSGGLLSRGMAMICQGKAKLRAEQRGKGIA